MPFTDEFNKLRRSLRNQYSDKAKAETFAFEKAFKNKIPTFTEERKPRFKKQLGGKNFNF